MSNDESTDLMELYEYDEFDSYDSHTYPTIEAIHSAYGVNSGVPLSVELSQCLSSTSHEQSTATTSHDNFIKAPEIFLRIDATNDGDRIALPSNPTATIDNVPAKSIDSIDSCADGEVKLSTNRDECIELQYEDEFIDSSDENDCEPANVIYERRNSIESDYEQLLFEGIDKKIYWKNYRKNSKSIREFFFWLFLGEMRFDLYFSHSLTRKS